MTDLTTIQPGTPALTDEDIALMESHAHASDFKKEDVLLPYLQLVQTTSGYMKRNDPDYLENAREGDITDSVTRKLRSRAAFLICKFETHYTEWKPNRGSLVRMMGNDRTAYDQAEGDFGTRKSPNGNDIVPTASYYGLLVDEDGSTLPCILGLGGTQFKKSRRLNTSIALLEQKRSDGTIFKPPNYAVIYSLASLPESNEKGSWAGWRIEPGPMTLSVPGGRALFDKASELREQIESGAVRAAPVDTAPRDPPPTPDERIPF